MKKKEFFIILILLLFAAGLYFFNKASVKTLTATVKNGEGEVLLTFNLNEDNCYSLIGKQGEFNIEVKDGQCRAYDVDCPNQICVHTGWIGLNNPVPIICLPNNIVVTIDEEK